MLKSFPATSAAPYLSNRLAKRLKTIASSPLTLVEAPIGYGKTVAVREFLRKRRARVAWMGVSDAGEDVFWRDFCRSVARIFPENAEIADSLLRLGYPRTAAQAHEAREVIQQLAFSPETFLVVDDVHLLPETECGGIFGLCTTLARQHIDGLHLVLISRNIWTAKAGGREILRLKGRLSVLDRDLFALRAEEIQGFSHRYGLKLSLRDAAALREITGGWIGALHLCLSRYGEDGALSCRASVNALLEEEVYASLPEQTRELLLLLSPLEHFTREQAEFLFGETYGVPAILRDLQWKNSFLTRNAENKKYTIHGMLRQYLRERFGQLPHERRTDAHIRMAQWFEHVNDVCQAIKAWQAAGEYERALCLLENNATHNLVTATAGFFTELFRECPEEILDRHMGAAFKNALAAFVTGDQAAFTSQLDWIKKKCAALAAEKGDADPEAVSWKGELELLLSFAAYNDIRAMTKHHRNANALLGRPTRLYGPESAWTLGCPSVLFMFHRTKGKLDEELALLKESLPHYYTLTSMHGAGAEHLMQAEVLYSRGEFANAAVACGRAEAMARGNGQTGIVLCCLFLRARLALLEGKREKAAALTQTMRGMAGKKTALFLQDMVALCEGYLHAVTGNPEQIPEWLHFGLGGEEKLPAPAGGYYYVAHGQVLLLANEYADAAGLFAWLLESGAFRNNLMFAIHAHLYIAAASTGLGLRAEADEALRAALDLALPDRLYMPFVENAVFLPQLNAMNREQPLAQGIRHIVSLAASLKTFHKGNTVHRLRGDISLLTRRERELAQLSLTGMTFKEIAAALNLAPSTVKRAFATMYKKLGINSREQLACKIGSAPCP